MSLILISKKIEPQKETLMNVALASVKANLRFIINENSVNNFNAISVYIDRNYGRVDIEDLECFSLDIHAEEWVRERFNKKLLNLEVGSSNYYSLAGTDQAEHDHLIYDFSLEYLRIRPDHGISLYGETFFFLEDMKKLESQGGYYKDWCFKPKK